MAVDYRIAIDRFRPLLLFVRETNLIILYYTIMKDKALEYNVERPVGRNL